MENNIISLNYLGQNVNILKFISESNSQFNKRLEFIKKMENEKVIWKEAHRLSKIWYCNKFKKCKYSNEIYQTIKKYE